jgi:hypothetical protein
MGRDEATMKLPLIIILPQFITERMRLVLLIVGVVVLVLAVMTILWRRRKHDSPEQLQAETSEVGKMELQDESPAKVDGDHHEPGVVMDLAKDQTQSAAIVVEDQVQPDAAAAAPVDESVQPPKESENVAAAITEEEGFTSLEETPGTLNKNLALIVNRLDQFEEGIQILRIARPQIESLADRMTKLEEEVSKVASGLDGLNASIRADLKTYFEELAIARKEEETRRKQHEERARQELLKNTREVLHFRLSERLNKLYEHSNVLRVSLLTDEIISELRAGSEITPPPEKVLYPYLEVSDQTRKLTGKLDHFDELPQLYLDDKEQGIEAEFELFERSIDKLEKAHRVVWFTNLLEEVRRHAGLELKADQLRGLLNLELVDVVLGSTPHDLQDFEVVSADGMGRQSVISEVLENGYRLKDGGAIVKKPKVKVRLEG